MSDWIRSQKEKTEAIDFLGPLWSTTMDAKAKEGL